ncbi:unnamed protein product, partial [Timema podura]|nr:unnamed protein product [Timema podura]
KGYTYVTFICEATKFLPYLQNRLLAGGGHLVRRKVTSLDELAREEDYKVIVNCTGLQARHLVGDTSVVPVRGQVLRVSAPWQNEVIIDLSGDGHYIIPNQESVVIGGTHQEGSWDLNVDPEDTQYILEGCRRIRPALKHAPLQRAWVGLRPSRPSVRLELGDPIRGEGRTTLVSGAQLRTWGQRGHPMLGLCHPSCGYSARGTSGLQALSIPPAENVINMWIKKTLLPPQVIVYSPQETLLPPQVIVYSPQETLLPPQVIVNSPQETLLDKEVYPHLHRGRVDNHLKYTQPRFEPRSPCNRRSSVLRE